MTGSWPTAATRHRESGKDSGMTVHGLTDEVLALRRRMKDFIDGEVVRRRARPRGRRARRAAKALTALKDEAKARGPLGARSPGGDRRRAACRS